MIDDDRYVPKRLRDEKKDHYWEDELGKCTSIIKVCWTMMIMMMIVTIIIIMIITMIIMMMTLIIPGLFSPLARLNTQTQTQDV